MRSTGMALGGAVAAAGFGLLMWCGITTALLQLRPGGASALSLVQGPGLVLGLLLAAGGRLAAHRTRAWRGRSGVLATGAALTACVLVGALQFGLALRDPNTVGVVGVLLVLLAFGAIAADSATSGGGDPRARPLQVPIQLLFAMATGLGLLYLLMEQRLGAAGDGRLMLATLLGLGSVLALCHVVDGQTTIARQRPAPSLRQRARVPSLLVAGPALALVLASSGWLPAMLPLAMATLALLAASLFDRREPSPNAAAIGTTSNPPDRAPDHGF